MHSREKQRWLQRTFQPTEPAGQILFILVLSTGYFVSLEIEVICSDPYVEITQDKPMGDVLVIDDDLEIRLFMKHALRSAGHAVLLASDGDEAIGMASNFPVDVAIIDMQMPNCDGFEVAEILEEHNPTIKKVVITGAEELLPQMEKLGADKILLKPISLETLLRAVNRFFDLSLV